VRGDTHRGAIDGEDTYGFPFTFHVTYSGMCDPCPETSGATDYLKLLADLGIAFLIGLALWKVFDMVRQSFRKPSPNNQKES
jgi:hypothetical protein